MRLTKPIPLLTKWHHSRLAGWIRRNDPAYFGRSPYIYTAWLIIVSLGILYVPERFKLLFALITMTLFILTGILYFAATEQTAVMPPPLTPKRKKQLIATLRNKAKGKRYG